MQTPRSVGGFIRRSEHRCGSHGEPRSDGEPGLKLAKRIPATAMCHVIGVLLRMKLRLVTEYGGKWQWASRRFEKMALW
jgi:hypothetical protein